jgi:hypothetical protein
MNLSSRLTPILEHSLYYEKTILTIAGIIRRSSSYHHSWTIKLFSEIYVGDTPVKFSLTGERRRLESNYNSAEGVFLTLTHDFPHWGTLGHLWYNSGTNVTGSVSASTLRDYHSTRMFRTFKSPALGFTPMAPFWGALYTYRLPAWFELLSFVVGLQTRLTKREACIQHDKERLQESVLNRYRRG